MLTRSELMLRTAQTELKDVAETLLEKLANFENNYPKNTTNLDETLYSKTDLNLSDLKDLLQTLSEITD